MFEGPETGAGGSHAVAARLGWRTQRRERAALRDAEAAAAALAEFIEQLPRSRMPTHAQLRSAGRHDLRYALQARTCSAFLIPHGRSIHDREHQTACLPVDP